MAVTTLASGTFTPSTVTTRTVADGVTNTTTTITSATAAFIAGDVGRIVTGSTDLVSGAYIASVTNGTTAILSVAATGSHSSQTFNLTNEYVMTGAETTAAGTYTYGIDLVNMAAGDYVEVRVYKMPLTGGTRRCYLFQSWADAFGSDDTFPRMQESVPVSTALTDTGALRFTIRQLAGTARAFPWEVEKYA